MIGAAVAVVIGGALVTGSTPAKLRHDAVAAPLAPYLRDLADRIDVDGKGRIVLERGERIVWFSIGSPVLHTAAGPLALPFAPYLLGGEPLLPLAPIARALGASVAYDGPSHVLSIATTPQPLVTMTPDAAYRPPLEPLETFTPNPVPAPAIQVTGSPRPRRTPIPVETFVPHG